VAGTADPTIGFDASYQTRVFALVFGSTEEGRDPDAFIAITITEYTDPPVNPLNVAELDCTPLSTDGVVRIPFNLYEYEVASIAPCHETVNPDELTLVNVRLIGKDGGYNTPKNLNLPLRLGMNGIYFIYRV
jgi:hypothetical protein